MASITNLDRVRAAFATGVSLESSAALHAARDTGSGWEAVTEAVAAGLAERFATAGPSTGVPVAEAPARMSLAGATAWQVIRTATRLRSRTLQMGNGLVKPRRA